MWAWIRKLLSSRNESRSENIADSGIATFVTALRDEGLKTAESFQAMDIKDGETVKVPAAKVRFKGGMAALFKAFSIAQACGLPVIDVRVAYYSVRNRLGFSQMGSWWEITFAAQTSYSDFSNFPA